MASRCADDRGYLGPSMAIFMFALLIIAGFAVDMGGQMRTMQKADDVAREAGRQGAQAVDISLAMAGNADVVDPAAAQAAAQAYLDSTGISGTVSVTGGNTLDITTSTSYDPIILGIIGVKQLSAKGHARVQLVRVVAGQER